MRHSFVSLLSASGLPIEHIPRLVRHKNTTAAETVDRHELRPILDAMDRILPPGHTKGRTRTPADPASDLRK